MRDISNKFIQRVLVLTHRGQKPTCSNNWSPLLLRRYYRLEVFALVVCDAVLFGS